MFLFLFENVHVPMDSSKVFTRDLDKNVQTLQYYNENPTNPS